MKIFCSGIGGIGLSAYAALRHASGDDVSGSDRSESPLLQDLRSQGMRVSTDQSGKGIEQGTQLLVYSEAIPADAPERREAERRGIPQQSYPEALGAFLKGRRVIAICGTHGKSSTTAMAARVLTDAGWDPTVVVGTKMKELNGRNWRNGQGEWCVIEACEYRRSFLHYDPEIVLLTTCDGDHFDYYSSLEDYRSAFVSFLRKVPDTGYVVTHMEDSDCRIIAEKSQKNVLDADAFPLPDVGSPGMHMRQNGRLVLALADVLGISSTETLRSLRAYSGSWRRMDVKGTRSDGVVVIDDYAHHPVEIAATLEGIRSAYPGRRVVCVFQPHTHDRTLKLYGDFTKAFRGAAAVIIPNVYVARSDIETARVDVGTFAADIAKESGTEAIDGRSVPETETLLRKMLRPNDVLLCMGAGNVTDLATKMIS